MVMATSMLLNLPSPSPSPSPSSSLPSASPSPLSSLTRRHIALTSSPPHLNQCIPSGNSKNVKTSCVECRARVTDCDGARVTDCNDDAFSGQAGVIQATWSTHIGTALMIGLTVFQMSAPISSENVELNWHLGRAEAVLYSPDTKVPRNAEVALRRAIPAVNSATKNIQDSLEDLFYLLRIPQRKPFGTMEGDVKKAIKLAMEEKESILAAVPSNEKEKGAKLLEDLISAKGGLQTLLASISDKDPDKISLRLASCLESIAQLELLQAPGLPYLVPNEYQQFPRLTGRAKVEFTVKRADGSTFTVASGGGPQGVGMIEIVLDGYSAPLTSGNFAKLVLDGTYNGMKLRATEQAIISDNEQSETGRILPVEILPAGEFQPLYRTTLNVQDGELPVLPLSVYGAVAMAHNPTSEDYSAPSQFFFYLYDKRSAGLGGLSFDEGQFSVFGYVTKGKELLSQLKTGDTIESAKLVSGGDKLVIN